MALYKAAKRLRDKADVRMKLAILLQKRQSFCKPLCIIFSSFYFDLNLRFYFLDLENFKFQDFIQIL